MSRPRRHPLAHDRPLRLEPLEDRRMLATITVNTLSDAVDGDFSAGNYALREALDNAAPGDVINFASSLTSGGPATIQLSDLGHLEIDKNLTVSGPGAHLLTIRAHDPTPTLNNGDGNRVFSVDRNDEAVIIARVVGISGLTIAGGDVEDDGGGIRNAEQLTLTQTVVSGNHSQGSGGGVSSSGESLTVNRSVVTGNVSGFQGGGLFSYGNLSVAASTISSNSAVYGGGGVRHSFGDLIVADSTISGNAATDAVEGRGGGILSFTNLGGSAGYYGYTGPRTTRVTNSTISGNAAAKAGGGLFNNVGLTVIRHSTVTGNSAPSGQGGGVASYGDAYARTEVHSTIIAANSGGDVSLVGGAVNSFQSLGYNLVGAGGAIGAFSPANGDQTGAAPMLAALADNGGPTMTHALLAGSGAVNMGHPAAAPGSGAVPPHDQRGSAFSRVQGGRIDIGAVESSFAPPPDPSADFDDDGDVDGADFLTWQRGVGTNAGAQHDHGDADYDGAINGDDLTVWEDAFSPGSAAAVVIESAAVAMTEPRAAAATTDAAALDAALAAQAQWLARMHASQWEDDSLSSRLKRPVTPR